jgi:hypothetical protein
MSKFVYIKTCIKLGVISVLPIKSVKIRKMDIIIL